MTETPFLAASPDVVLALRIALRVLHFAGLVIGLGAATMLDFYLMQRRHQTVTAEMTQFVDQASQLVAIGLGLLWLSGLGFLLHYAQFDAEKLANPKVWAKITIVLILTINGGFIHYLVLPYLRASIGYGFLERLSPGRQQLFIAIGVLSAISWYIPLLLGSIPQLNFAVPAALILSIYGIVLIIGISLAVLFIAPREARSLDGCPKGN